MYAKSFGVPLMSAQTVAGPLLVREARRPVVLSLDELAAPRAATSGVGPAQPEVVAVEDSERGAVTAGRLVGLLGSATFAGWTSLTCFVC